MVPSPADQKSCERMHPDQKISITASGGFKVAKPLIKFVKYPLVAPSPMGGSMAQFATCQILVHFGTASLIPHIDVWGFCF